MRVRGRLVQNIPLSTLTWLQVGGPVSQVFYPQDAEDLSCFLKTNTAEGVIGAGSNILARDSGLDGTIIKLGKGFYRFDLENTKVHLGAGLLDRYVAQKCQMMGLSGLEFLFTIPGTIGGGVCMNAGCYGGEFSDRLVSVTLMDTEGQTHILNASELDMSYRHCSLPMGSIVLEACFQCVTGDPAKIQQLMDEFTQRRKETHPAGVHTGGSTFMNPPGHSAWELIAKAGYRGRIKGGAQFSEKHCNFLINRGHATAADLEGLALEAQKAVYEQSHIQLQLELVRWGETSKSLGII